MSDETLPEVPDAFDDDVMERHAREDWLAFQRDLDADWRL